MSDAYIASLQFARKQVGTYFGLPVLITSIVGEVLSIIVLVSLKTFRQNSCGFYLLAVSIFNVLPLSLSTVFIIISLSFGIDYSISILFFCQIRNFFVTLSTMSSITCLCLAVIDQYFATSTRLQWQQWSNIKLAHRITTIITLIWTVNGILYAINFSEISPTNTAVCIPTNPTFLRYHNYGYLLTYNNILPLIAAVFGLMAFRNVRNMRYRTVPLVRRELEKQLTVMALVQMLVYVCAYLPFAVVAAISAVKTNRDPLYLAKMNLANAVTLVISVYSNGSTFYTYICVSQRFRRQFHGVLYRICVVRCFRNQINPNYGDN